MLSFFLAKMPIPKRHTTLGNPAILVFVTAIAWQIPSLATTITVDNHQAGFSSQGWPVATNGAGYIGPNYAYTGPGSTGSTATWTTSSLQPGWHRISVTNVPTSYMEDQAQYTISHLDASGNPTTTNLVVSQRLTAVIDLGIYNTGSSSSVTLTNGSDWIIADSVSWELDVPNIETTVEVTSTATSISTGQSVTISWDAEAAIQCTDWDGNVVSDSGSAVLSPTQSQSFVVACSGPLNNGTGSVDVIVDGNAIGPAPTITESFASDYVLENETSTWTWTTTDADFCLLNGTDLKGASDQHSEVFASSTELSLVCVGSGGSAIAEGVAVVRFDTDNDGILDVFDNDDDADGKPDEADDHPLDIVKWWDEVVEYSPSFPHGISGIMAYEEPWYGVEDTPGNVPYSAGVDGDGLANVNIPLQLPPGVNGLVPYLAIDYSSGRVKNQKENFIMPSYLGHGWDVVGLSSIRRCLTPGGDADLQLTDEDSLCLDGNRLIMTSGSDYWSDGNVYRLEIDNFAQIKSFTISGDLYFEVRTHDGRIHTYGLTADSRIEAGGSDELHVWAINQTKDRFNNEINYTYHTNQNIGEYYPDTITYDGASIVFEYKVRELSTAPSLFEVKPKTHFGPGFGQRSVVLHSIRTKINDELVRHYRFARSTGTYSVVPTGIQVCGYDEGGLSSSRQCIKSFSWIWSSNPVPEIVEITDPLGLRTKFYYDWELPDATLLPDFRGLGDGSCELSKYENDDARNQNTRRYVTRMDKWNGIWNVYWETWYYYRGSAPKYELNNRGYVGHDSIVEHYATNNKHSYTKRHQCFPFAGATAATHLYNDNTLSAPLAKTETIWFDTPLNSGATQSIHAQNSVVLNYEDNVQFGITETETNHVFDALTQTPSQTTTTTRVAPTASLIANAWALNNIERESIQLNSYQIDEPNWLNGFMTNNTVTNKAPGQSDKVLTSTSTRYGNTAKAATVSVNKGSAGTLLTTFAYDLFGNTTSVSQDDVGSGDPVRTTTYSNFIDNRYPGMSTDAMGHESTFNYDKRFGTRSVATDANSNTGSVLRDPFGRITTHYQPNGNWAVHIWERGNYNRMQRTTIRARQENTHYKAYMHYDHLGRKIEERFLGYAGGLRFVTYSYDRQGRMYRTTLPFSNGNFQQATIYEFDEKDRHDKVTKPNGEILEYDFTVEGNRLKTTIDKTVTIPGQANEVRTSYQWSNSAGDIVETQDPLGIVANFDYDPLGNLISSEIDNNVETVVTTTYDTAGNKLSVTTPDSGTVSYEWNAFGQNTKQTDAKGQISEYTYDIMGRVKQRIDDVGSPQAVTNTWTYDGATGYGKLASVSNGDYTESYTYDATTGQIASVTTDIDSELGSHTFTTQYTYHPLGHLDKTTYPGGYIVENIYYSSANNHIGYRDGTGFALVQNTAEDALGNVTARLLGNGHSEFRTYEYTGELLTINRDAVMLDDTYTWRSGGVLHSRARGSATETFEYDALDRLTSATTTGSVSRTLSYAYDNLGNITSKTSDNSLDTDVTGYVYGAGAAGPHAVTSVDLDGITHTLNYDLNGSVTSMSTGPASKDFEYNSLNRTTEITTVNGSDTTDTDFFYNTNGDRYFKKHHWGDGTDSGTSYTFYLMNGKVDVTVPEDPAIDSITTINVSSEVQVKQTTPISGSTTTDIRYRYRDHLGSIVYVTDENGAVVSDLAYEPFGGRREADWSSSATDTTVDGIIADANSTPSRGYTDHEHLDSSGVIHMNGRIYEPVIGRFLSADPWLRTSTMRLDLNRYAYVRNNPLRYTDPSGEKTNEPTPGCGSACSSVQDTTIENDYLGIYEGINEAAVDEFINMELAALEHVLIDLQERINEAHKHPITPESNLLLWQTLELAQDSARRIGVEYNTWGVSIVYQDDDGKYKYTVGEHTGVPNLLVDDTRIGLATPTQIQNWEGRLAVAVWVPKKFNVIDEVNGQIQTLANNGGVPVYFHHRSQGLGWNLVRPEEEDEEEDEDKDNDG